MDNIDDFQKQLDCIESFELDEVIVNKPKRLTNNPTKKRQRKTKKQMDVLEVYFSKSHDWSNEIIDEIAAKTGLKVKQVSKWLWDQKLKRKIDISEESIKPHKRVKIEEKESFDEFGGYSINNSNPPKANYIQNSRNKPLVDQLEIKLSVDNLLYNNPNDIKEKESVGTISMIDGLTVSKNMYVEPKLVANKSFSTSDSKKMINKTEKCENESVVSSKHSAKSLNFRERFSKLHKNKPLKIKAPSIDELIKKPNPINYDATNNFISNLSVYSKDLRSLPNNTPSSNTVINSTPGIFQNSVMRMEKKDFSFPLVFSRGQTPEIKQ